MPGLFVTATGTGVGKTFVTAGLIRAARRADIAVDALKPVMSGYDPSAADASDAGLLLAALGRPVTPDTVAAIAPWRFAAPLAPDMAAAAEGRTLDVAAVIAACRAAVTADALTLIEGVGGVMVPLDDRHTVLDLIAALAIPILLVTGSELGAISHGLAAIAALSTHGASPCLVVLDETADSTVPLDATARTLRAHCRGIPVAVIRQSAPEAAFDDLLVTIGRVAPFRPAPSRPARTPA